MTAPNHALTGALIGLSISNPVLALPLAFLSHFVLDAIPHYDVPGDAALSRINTKRFVHIQIYAGAMLCFLLVVLLAAAHPQHWLLAAVCAFLATAADLLWIPRFLHIRRTGRDVDLAHSNWFWRFHDWIQWRTGPKLAWVEAVWFVVFAAWLVSKL